MVRMLTADTLRYFSFHVLVLLHTAAAQTGPMLKRVIQRKTLAMMILHHGMTSNMY